MERLLWYPLPIIYLRVTVNNNISITDWRYRCRYPSCPLLKTHLLLSQVGPGVKKQSFSNVPKTFQGQYWNLMKISFNIFARLKKKPNKYWIVLCSLLLKEQQIIRRSEIGSRYFWFWINAGRLTLRDLNPQP